MQLITGKQGEDDVMPMMTIVNCVPEMTPVVEQVFGRVLVCRNFDVALRAVKTYDIDCVTLEGDTVKILLVACLVCSTK